MPVGVLAKGREQTTLVFDTWANVADGELLIHWPCNLTHEETDMLNKLATALGYLGRSESWVEAELIAENQAGDVDSNAFPHRDGMHPGRHFEQVPLMAPIPPEQYREWQQQQAENALAPFPLPVGNRKPSAKLVRDRERAVAPFPPDLPSCLTKDTAWWKQHGWSQPPGLQRVLYWCRSAAIQVSVPAQPKRSFAIPVEFMLLALTTPSGNRAALPSVTRTLPQAELFHRVIIAKAARGGRFPCQELTGKDEHGNPLHGRHHHAHTIPLDLDRDGHIDHILIYAKGKLNDDAQTAIRQCRETWQKKGPDLQVAVVGSGDLSVLRQLPSRLNIQQFLGRPEGCRVWESATPFVFPRFLKPRGKNTMIGQINAELVSRGLPEVQGVHINRDITRELRHFVRRRNHGGAAPVDTGYGLRLTFYVPLQGPLLLGYGSHYGLGLFRARLGEE
jgi:CRISPR-associated protein Csb2